jgi:replicative DNA helicase
VVVAARPAMGKALALDTPIPTPDGWRTMGALRVGDQVFDEAGRPCTVTFATPVQLDRECYGVVFSDGERIVADADHLWSVKTRAARKAGSGRRATVTTRQMLADLRVGSDRRLNYSIPAAGALEYPARDLPVDPYVLGVWLGDGHTNHAVVTLGDPEIAAELVAVGCPVRPRQVAGTAQFGLGSGRGWAQPRAKLAGTDVLDIRSRLAAGERPRTLAAEFQVSSATIKDVGSGRIWKDPDRPLAIQSKLRALGVLGRKHIPRLYQEASPPQRLALLQGLMDTDGHIDNLGHAEFFSTREELADGVRELVTGFGLTPRLTVDRAWFNDVDYGPRYRVRFKPTELPVCRLARKAIRQKLVAPNARVRDRFISDIRPVTSVPVRCIQVDSPNHLYLAGRACVPTHNTSLATAIALHAAVHAQIPVAIFSLEMSKEQLVERLLCQQAKIDSQRMHRGMLSDREYEQLVMAIGPLENAPIYIDESPVLDELTVLLKARQAKLQYNIGLVVIDYLQLMKGRGGKDDNRVQEVSSISRSLKGLARELKIPVIALSQLSRGPEARPNKRPMLSDLRDSGSIEQDSDLVIFLYRDDYYNDKSEEPGIAEIIISKHRNGPTGTLKLRFRKEHTLFYNLESRRSSADEE